ncbi:MAG: tRNA pseudouridine(55) synthase TruB [Acidobacteria bacterium]|nr:tRNA pseudouridine(55) synthase TruB [Acidobacteriota bacterium]
MAAAIKPTLNGTLILNKSEDWTSHDVVAKLRRILGERRIGHAGTLDPFATGVLVVCVGAATRLVQYLVGLEKEYIATVRLGFATDTQDYTGKPISPLVSPMGVTAATLEPVLNEFRGEQLQLPPMFSAKKIDGQRLHQAARAGREIERQPVGITIHSLALLNDGTGKVNEDGTMDFVMRVRCSSGTYIRTLAHDIGAQLGIGAHLSALQRTAVGRFTLAESLRLQAVEEQQSAGALGEHLISLADTISHLPRLTLPTEQVNRLANGREVRWHEPELAEATISGGGKASAIIGLCNVAGELVALGEWDTELRVIKPKTVFVSPKN